MFQYGTAQNLNANQFEKEHYVFGGWKSTNGRTFDDQQSVQNLTDTDGANHYSDCYLERKRLYRGTYNIILHSNNGSDTTQEVAAEFGVNKTLPKNTFYKKTIMISRDGAVFQVIIMLFMSMKMWLK